MPKVLLYITAKLFWTFLFYNKDYNENRAHVHVGKKDTQNLCKIWLEPQVEIAKQGDLTDSQANEVLALAAYNAGIGNVREWMVQYGWKRMPPVKLSVKSK